MTATELRNKYEPTYTSWRNMKRRSKTSDALVSTEFDKFNDFLRIVGPRPSAEFTLDRTDPSDPEYAPGKVEWRDLRDQANNRRTTISLEMNGEFLPLTEWARRTGQPPDTLRRRHSKGWSDSEVINGKMKMQKERTYVGNYRDAQVPWPGTEKEQSNS